MNLNVGSHSTPFDNTYPSSFYSEQYHGIYPGIPKYMLDNQSFTNNSHLPNSLQLSPHSSSFVSDSVTTDEQLLQQQHQLMQNTIAPNAIHQSSVDLYSNSNDIQPPMHHPSSYMANIPPFSLSAPVSQQLKNPLPAVFLSQMSAIQPSTVSLNAFTSHNSSYLPSSVINGNFSSMLSAMTSAAVPPSNIPAPIQIPNDNFNPYFIQPPVQNYWNLTPARKRRRIIENGRSSADANAIFPLPPSKYPLSANAIASTNPFGSGGCLAGSLLPNVNIHQSLPPLTKLVLPPIINYEQRQISHHMPFSAPISTVEGNPFHPPPTIFKNSPTLAAFDHGCGYGYGFRQPLVNGNSHVMRNFTSVVNDEKSMVNLKSVSPFKKKRGRPRKTKNVSGRPFASPKRSALRSTLTFEKYYVGNGKGIELELQDLSPQRKNGRNARGFQRGGQRKQENGILKASKGRKYSTKYQKPPENHFSYKRIRVWRDKQDRKYFDCTCNARKPCQDLNKIKMHVIGHDREVWKCPYCPKVFSNNHLQLNAHMKTHKKKKIHRNEAPTIITPSSSLQPKTGEKKVQIPVLLNTKIKSEVNVHHMNDDIINNIVFCDLKSLQ